MVKNKAVKSLLPKPLTFNKAIFKRRCSTSPCPTDSCRNGAIPLESAGMAPESTGMALESTGIHRNLLEWHRNPLEWHRNLLEWHHSCMNPQEFTKIDFGDKSLIKTYNTYI
jgi:hypothetical protein